MRSPRGAKGRAGRGQKESTAAFGPMPNFEREVQRIIAQQEVRYTKTHPCFKKQQKTTSNDKQLNESQVVSDMEQSEPPAGQQQQHGGSPAKRKEELVIFFVLKLQIFFLNLMSCFFLSSRLRSWPGSTRVMLLLLELRSQRLPARWQSNLYHLRHPCHLSSSLMLDLRWAWQP